MSMTGVSVLGPRPPRQLKGDSVERATLLPILFVVNGDGQNGVIPLWRVLL